jgi:hypothetical protein
MLRDIIIATERRMKEDLNLTRTKFRQSSDKGDCVEESFRQFMRDYLPRRLTIGQGEIIDSKGLQYQPCDDSGRSSQTDFVIATEDHPFTAPQTNLPGLFFIDGVSGAGEIKAVLTGTELNTSLRNSLKFKSLECLPVNGMTYIKKSSDRDLLLNHPPWFLVAFESQISLEKVQQKIIEFSNLDIQSNFLDAVFILNRGWVINFRDGQASFRYSSPDGTNAKGWCFKGSDTVLFDLLTWMTVIMPRKIWMEPFLQYYMGIQIEED